MNLSGDRSVDAFKINLTDAEQYFMRGHDVLSGTIKELARSAVLGEPNDENAVRAQRSAFSALLKPRHRGDDVVRREDAPRVFGGAEVLSGGERGALYSEYVCGYIGELCADLTLEAEYPESDNVNVALMQGRAADIAAGIFARRYGLSPLYRDRIVTVCNSVITDEARYCIVPIRSGRDGLLKPFYRAIEDGELIILSSTAVNVGDSLTLYALCGREGERSLTDAPAFCEITCAGGVDEVLRISEAVTTLGHGVLEIAADMTESGNEIYRVRASLSGECRPLILYLNLYHPTSYILGIYEAV